MENNLSKVTQAKKAAKARIKLRKEDITEQRYMSNKR